MKTSKLVDFHDFTSSELQPYFKKLAEIQMDRFGIFKPSIAIDSKNWEIAMALYSFEKYNLSSKGKFIAVIGDDNFSLTHILSKSGSIVFSVDKSSGSGLNEIINQSNCFSERAEGNHIISIQTDIHRLAIPSDFFDAIFVSGTAEYFTETNTFQSCIAEIARVLKPGGYVSITAGFLVDGPEHTTPFGYPVPILTREFLQRKIMQFSGLDEVDSLLTTQSHKTYETRRGIINFLEADYNGDYTGEKGLVRYCDGFLFTTIHVFLSKPIDWKRSEESQTFIESVHAKFSSNRFSPKTPTHFDPAMLGIKRMILLMLSKFPFIYRFLRKSVSNKAVKYGVVDLSLRAMYAKIKPYPTLRAFLVQCCSCIPGLLPALRKRLNRVSVSRPRR